MPSLPHAPAHLAALGRNWIAAWNSHDLERVLALYADDTEMTSDRIPAFGFDASGTLRGKANLRMYLGKGAAPTCISS
jgi:ketosteroid isomerase-like protein